MQGWCPKFAVQWPVENKSEREEERDENYSN